MRILRLTAENIKKLQVVDIAPDGSIVQITGANGSGKSSVLDSIWYALAGTKNIPSIPIRTGSTSARIRLDLGEVIVTRKFTESGSSLIVEAESGARFPSPQTLLDDLLGDLTFDPLEFSSMEPARQLEQLKKLVPLDVDLDKIERANDIDYERRRDIHRTIKKLTSQSETVDVPEDLPEYSIDVTEILEQMDNGTQHNQELVNLDRERAELRRKIVRDREEAEHLRASAAELEERARKLQHDADDLATSDFLAGVVGTPIDLTELRYSLSRAHEVNAGIERRNLRKQYLEEIADLKEVADSLTAKMDERTIHKTRALEAAQMPIPGLSFGKGEVIYNGVPLEQASDAEQLRISVAIAMAMNPKLRVLRIKQGSLLDEKGMAMLLEMGEQNDYQIWIERVDTSGKVGVFMEDGVVADHPDA